MYVTNAVPEANPETIPVEDPTVTSPEEELHTPATLSARAICDPAQTDEGPVNGGGEGFTVTIFEREQPVGIL